MLSRLLMLLALLMLTGCASRTDSTPNSAPPASAEAGTNRAERAYRLRGVVESVDRERGVAAIRHEAIPGFMDAMTMPFDLKGQVVLDDLQVGDTVEGRLVVGSEGTRLTEVNITALADPALAGGGPSKAKVLEPGETVPDFAMTTQEGETLRLSDLRGKTVVLTFIYTRCPLPEFCPLMDRRFGELARGLALDPAAAEGVRLLSVSFDPEHDTPQVLRAHARRVGAEPPLWTVAVADHDELRKVAEPLGLMYGPTGGEIIHSLSTAVLDPEGRLARLWTGRDWSVGDVRQAVRKAAEDAPASSSAEPGDPTNHSGQRREVSE